MSISKVLNFSFLHVRSIEITILNFAINLEGLCDFTENRYTLGFCAQIKLMVSKNNIFPKTAFFINPIRLHS